MAEMRARAERVRRVVALGARLEPAHADRGDRQAQRQPPRVQRRQQPGPARIAVNEILHPLDFGPALRPRRRRAQVLDQCRILALGEGGAVDLQRIGQPFHHLRRDLAAVVLDQVEVAGRNPRRRRRLRLPQPGGEPAVAQLGSGQGRKRHRTGPGKGIDTDQGRFTRACQSGGPAQGEAEPGKTRKTGATFRPRPQSQTSRTLTAPAPCR